MNRLLTLEDVYNPRQEYANCVSVMTELTKEILDTMEDVMNEYLETGADKTLDTLQKTYKQLVDK